MLPGDKYLPVFPGSMWLIRSKTASCTVLHYLQTDPLTCPHVVRSILHASLCPSPFCRCSRVKLDPIWPPTSHDMQTSSDWSMTNVGQLTQKSRCLTQNEIKSVYYTTRFAPSRVGLALDLAQNATNSRL